MSDFVMSNGSKLSCMPGVLESLGLRRGQQVTGEQCRAIIHANAFEFIARAEEGGHDASSLRATLRRANQGPHQ